MTNREYMETLSDYDLVRYLYDYVIPVVGLSYNQTRLGIVDWLGKEHGNYDNIKKEEGWRNVWSVS